MTGRHAYGVDLDSGFMAVVRAEGRRGRIVFGETRQGSEAAPVLSAARGEILRGRATLAAALPAGEAVLRRLEAPLRSVRKARRILPGLLEAGLPFPLEGCITVFSDLRRTGAQGPVRGLGMAALRARIETRQAALRNAGCEVTHLAHEALALWRRSIAEAKPADDNEPRAVLYASDARVALALGRGGALEAAYGAGRKSGADPTGARRALQAWRAGIEGEIRAFWVGPATAEEATRSQFETEWIRAGAMRFDRHAEPEGFLARALAAEALEAKDGGLLQGDLEPEILRETADRRLRRNAIAALAAGLVLAAGAFAWRAGLDRSEAAARDGLNRLARETTGAAVVSPGFEVERVRAHAAEAAETTAPLRVFFEPSLVTATAQLLGTAQTRGITVERLNMDRTVLEIEGRSGERPDMEALAERLRLLGYDLRPDVREDGEGGIRFNLRGTRP